MDSSRNAGLFRGGLMVWNCINDCGECCGIVHLPKKLWLEMKHKAQKKVIRLDEFQDAVTPVTEDGLCVFLTKGCTCAIYTKRPEICKFYGVLDCLPCPYLKSNGIKRTRQDKRRIQRKINKTIDAKLARLKI